MESKYPSIAKYHIRSARGGSGIFVNVGHALKSAQISGIVV